MHGLRKGWQAPVPQCAPPLLHCLCFTLLHAPAETSNFPDNTLQRSENNVPCNILLDQYGTLLIAGIQSIPCRSCHRTAHIAFHVQYKQPHCCGWCVCVSKSLFTLYFIQFSWFLYMQISSPLSSHWFGWCAAGRKCDKGTKQKDGWCVHDNGH